MNDLERYFHGNTGRLITKWDHYFSIYNRHFQRFRGKEVTLLEIGVCHGGSLQMWKHYFGDHANIFGVDIHPRTLGYQEEQISILIGDQEDRAFLKHLRETVPAPDIIIDDGGHTMPQQINTFEELYPWLKSDGVYLCEDTHTSYWPSFGGGYRNPGTFIELMKRHILALSQDQELDEPDPQLSAEFLRTAASVHCYDSIVAIEKSGSV